MITWHFSHYETQSGRSPVDTFLDKLNADEQAVISKKERFVEERWPIDRPHVDLVDQRERIYELLVQHLRILFWPDEETRTLLALHGFKKKTNKTPRKDIELAVQRKVDWLARRETR